MIELLQRYGILSPAAPSLPSPEAFQSQLALTAANDRRSTQIINLLTVGSGGKAFQSRRSRRSVNELKAFSESPLPSRAISLIRDTVSSLEYVVTNKKQAQSADESSVEAIQMVLDNPNTNDDDLQSFLGQIVEDVLMWDAGAWEYVENPANVPGNEILELAVVPGYTMECNGKWRGDPDIPRWRQNVSGLIVRDGSNEFLDSEIEYVVRRKRSWSSFGFSPLESAAELIDAWLNLSTFQREIASNAYPSMAFYLGNEVTMESATYQLFRQYWEQECSGRGRPPVLAGFGSNQPTSIPLKATGDQGLYLVYQEMLVRVLALCFGLKPMDLGLERDVNRNTAEVSQAQSIREAARPIAKLLERKFNQRVIPRIAKITNNGTLMDYEFEWTNIDPTDDDKRASVLSKYLLFDIYTIDEIRNELGLEELPNRLGELTPSAFKAYVQVNPEALQNGPTSQMDSLITKAKQKLLKEGQTPPAESGT